MGKGGLLLTVRQLALPMGRLASKMLEHTRCRLKMQSILFPLRQVGTIEEACELFPKADVLINFARWVLKRLQPSHVLVIFQVIACGWPCCVRNSHSTSWQLTRLHASRLARCSALLPLAATAPPLSRPWRRCGSPPSAWWRSLQRWAAVWFGLNEKQCGCRCVGRGK